MNKFLRFTTTTALAGSLSLLSVGSALADTASISNTGQNSTNVVTNSSSNNVTVTNANTVTVTNSNDQTATSGNATVDANTNAGSATTGNATNNATTSTTVGLPSGGAGVGGLGGFGNGSGTVTTVTGAGGFGGGSGSVLGASTVGGRGGGSGAATLPVTGPATPIDVSGLRSLYGSHSALPAIVNQSNTLSGAFLLMAAILSLIGALGSAVYANRREQQL